MTTPTSSRGPDHTKATLQSTQTKPSACLLRFFFHPFPIFSHIVLLPPQSWLTSKETEPARPAWSSHGGSDARVHAPQPASQPAGRVGSLLGPSCWAEMGADRGLQGRESGRADKTRGAQSLWGKPKPAGSQAGSSRGVSPCGRPGGRPRLGPAGPLLSSLSWLRPKPGSLGIPRAAKRALRVFPNPHCLMRSWKTWIFAFYTFAVDHIQVTA